MHKAYDTLFQTEITANDAARGGIVDDFRYECLCCGEEVFLAAKDSIHKSTHFRHRSGNNDVECEKYLGGGYNKYSYIRITEENLNLNYYFRSAQQRFFATIKISEENIQKHSDNSDSLIIRSDRNQEPIYQKRIDFMSFAPNKPYEIPLDRYSHVYYISIGTDNYRGSSLFSKQFPAFFKILGNDVQDFTAKLITSKMLFTKTKYFIVFNKENFDFSAFNDCEDISIEKSVSFETMNRIFHGMVFSITQKTQSVERLLYDYGISVEISEKCIPLWPPVYRYKDRNKVLGEDLFLYTTFLLKEKSTTDINQNYIQNYSENISYIFGKDKGKIKKSNVDESFDFEKQYNYDYCFLLPDTKQVFSIYKNNCDNAILSNDGYYSFLPNGKECFLKNGSFIMELDRNNYCLKVVNPQKPKEKKKAEILNDILQHCFLTEKYIDKNYASADEEINKYLQYCKETGIINSVVKRYLEEGLL